ncbi:hypothetical protein O181_088011 [Austropuccinia psidii MF-1]|uniref:Uncharacterized protein n=1 Tax=Austropuccinia psidii MF-1 TaxID=1389203 RepID=A0A9Q3IQS1_9BASI|nr:hypothetical protein [Austropuccinia psidii MF-1]
MPCWVANHINEFAEGQKNQSFQNLQKHQKTFQSPFTDLNGSMKGNTPKKMIAADVGDVAFVSVTDIPSGAKEHPDERLSNRAFTNKYWHLTIKDYEIKPDTPEDSDNYSVSISDSNKMIDLDANNQLDVDQNFVEQEIIEHEKREVKLVDKVEDVNEKDGDVLMADAWDMRSQNANARRISFDDEGGW